MNNNNKSMTRIVYKKKKKKTKKRILTFLFLVLLTAVTYFSYMGIKTYQALNNSYNEERKTSALREVPVYVSNDPFSVLIMGIEDYSGEHDTGRADTLLVATFNPKKQTMKLLSIPRDTMVTIADLDKKDKINHSYATGGKDRVIRTVENFLNIPIDYYVSVNFKGFVNIVDELGGVEVEVPFSFNDINSKWERFYFKKGSQELNGEEALVYARMRKKDPRGDFGRNERQRQIVIGLIDRLSSPKILWKIDDLAEVVGENVETNMSIKEAIAFRKKYSEFNTSKIQQLELKGEDYYSKRNIYYFIPDEEELEMVKSELRSHLDLPTDESDDYSQEDEQ
ncbi:LCP family protein [Peribacillus tepidiphilus]|uniref:LCP family protein n=1 Tax=Peribacillus tepidiphilus TaxID=2652445 RepID=UPI0035B52F31